jgi:plasmid stability protein
LIICDIKDINAIMALMASILIRRLDESLKRSLRVRAAQHGRSMEEEAREILRAALRGGVAGSANLAESIHARFAALGGIELPEVPREPISRPPKLGR